MLKWILILCFLNGVIVMSDHSNVKKPNSKYPHISKELVWFITFLYFQVLWPLAYISAIVNLIHNIKKDLKDHETTNS